MLDSFKLKIKQFFCKHDDKTTTFEFKKDENNINYVYEMTECNVCGKAGIACIRSREHDDVAKRMLDAAKDWEGRL